METLRIIMTSTFYPPHHLGGDAVHVKYLSEELAGRGHEVHVMYSRDAYRLKRKGSSEPSAGKASVHMLESPYGRLSTMKAYGFGNSGFILDSYVKLVRDVKPDLVHHHNISLLGHGILKKQGSYAQMYTAHDYWLACQRSDLMRKGKVCDDPHCRSCAISSGRPPQFWRKNLDVSGIDLIICPSRYMADRLSSLGRPMKVIPNFAPGPPEKVADAPDPGYFLYLGVVEPHKGIRELVRAFAKNGQRLVIAGRGNLSDYVEREIGAGKLAPRVKYAGWVEDKWSAMRGACAMILPSTWPENCPLSVLEAMAVGTPTFCTDLGGTKEIVEKISPNLVMPLEKLNSALEGIRPPALDRDLVRRTFADNYTAEKYIAQYLAAAEGCLST